MDFPPVMPGQKSTYTRVRKTGATSALDLMTALRKMTLQPAQRLEKRAPQFKNKGRIRVNADADITIFDPDRITDRATFDEPLQYSEGVEFVLVRGVPILNHDQLVRGIFPGRAVRASVLQ